MVTKKQLRRQLDFVSALTDRELQLESWCPGDGWCRYRVFELSHDGARAYLPYWMLGFRAGELQSALTLVVETLILVLGWEEYERRANVWRAKIEQSERGRKAR